MRSRNKHPLCAEVKQAKSSGMLVNKGVSEDF